MTIEILLADDDADDRLLFEEIFSEAGYGAYTLRQLTNGQEVIDHLNSLSNEQPLPALILLDHNMPNMTGEQTLRSIKDNPQFNSIPVVVYSTSIFGAFADTCRANGAALVIEKPGLYKEYKEMIEKVMAFATKGQAVG